MGSPSPSGIATIMFTDLVASTDTTTRLGDEAAARIFAVHNRIVEEQVRAFGGRQSRSTGDGYLLLFDSARKAVACALAIHRELEAQEAGVQVRIGLNAGEVTEDGDDLFGAAINLASRVMDRAGGGQVLVTDAVRQLVGTMPGVRFRDRGRVALKGFPERHRLHEVLPADGEPVPRPRKRRSLRPALAAAALALAGGGAAVLLAGGGEGIGAVRPNSVVILDASDGEVVGQVPVGAQPGHVAVDDSSVWVANREDRSVTQIDRRSQRVVASVAAGIDIDGMAASPGAVWLADNHRGVAQVIDPSFRSVADTVRIGEGGFSVGANRPIAASGRTVWISGGTKIRRMDARSHRVLADIPVGNDPTAIAVAGDAVWVSDSADGTVSRIDGRTNELVATIPVGRTANGIAADSRGAWVAVPGEDRVKRIDPVTNAVADAVPVAGAPSAVAIGGRDVWVTSPAAGTVTRIDAASPRVVQVVELGQSPRGAVVAGNHLFVTVQAGAAGAAGPKRDPDVLQVLRPFDFDTTDPALSAKGWQLLHSTCALLLNHPDRPFPAGAELQPEVAEAMPEVTDGGRTYKFRIRPGFRFSPPSGEAVTAQSFVRAIERSLHPKTGSFAAVGLRDVVGVGAYRAGRAEHVSGVTANGNELTIRLSAPSADLPAKLASFYFCAVPQNTPIRKSPVERIPMAGPYYFAEYEPARRLVMRRNPNYRGDRPARMEEIVFALDATGARGVREVESGRADYLTDVPLERVPDIERRYGRHSPAAQAGRQRYFSSTGMDVHRFAFNTRRPLFASRRMRLAVNAALDRPALAAHLPMPPPGVRGHPTDQLIPAGLPGFRDVAIHPVAEPDLERARRLAGTRRRRATLVTCTLPGCIDHGRVARRNLAAIGIDLKVVNLPLLRMFDRLHRPGDPWDLGYYPWFIDYADPADFVLLYSTPSDSGGNVGGFYDRRIARRMEAAAPLTGEKRLKAFAEVDEALMREGAAAPFASSATTDFFSDRIGCQVQQPIYGISLGALCLRDQGRPGVEE